MELQPETQDDSQRMLMTLGIMMAIIMIWSMFLRPSPPPAADKADEKIVGDPGQAELAEAGTRDLPKHSDATKSTEEAADSQVPEAERPWLATAILSNLPEPEPLELDESDRKTTEAKQQAGEHTGLTPAILSRLDPPVDFD